MRIISSLSALVLLHTSYLTLAAPTTHRRAPGADLHSTTLCLRLTLPDLTRSDQTDEIQSLVELVPCGATDTGFSVVLKNGRPQLAGADSCATINQNDVSPDQAGGSSTLPYIPQSLPSVPSSNLPPSEGSPSGPSPFEASTAAGSNDSSTSPSTTLDGRPSAPIGGSSGPPSGNGQGGDAIGTPGGFTTASTSGGGQGQTGPPNGGTAEGASGEPTPNTSANPDNQDESGSGGTIIQFSKGVQITPPTSGGLGPDVITSIVGIDGSDSSTLLDLKLDGNIRSGDQGNTLLPIPVVSVEATGDYDKHTSSIPNSNAQQSSKPDYTYVKATGDTSDSVVDGTTTTGRVHIAEKDKKVIESASPSPVSEGESSLPSDVTVQAAPGQAGPSPISEAVQAGDSLAGEISAPIGSSSQEDYILSENTTIA